MTRIHWIARQNKLETHKEKDEVNKREVHECDGRARDADAMVAPPTPKAKHGVAQKKKNLEIECCLWVLVLPPDECFRGMDVGGRWDDSSVVEGARQGKSVAVVTEYDV
jgi:hypothetical protein